MNGAGLCWESLTILAWVAMEAQECEGAGQQDSWMDLPAVGSGELCGHWGLHSVTTLALPFFSARR